MQQLEISASCAEQGAAVLKRIFADVHMGFTELRTTFCVLDVLVFLLAVRKLSIFQKLLLPHVCSRASSPHLQLADQHASIVLARAEVAKLTGCPCIAKQWSLAN